MKINIDRATLFVVLGFRISLVPGNISFWLFLFDRSSSKVPAKLKRRGAAKAKKTAGAVENDITDDDWR